MASLKAKLLILLVLLIMLYNLFDIRIVNGKSMIPSFSESTVIMVFKSPFYEYKSGDIVVAKDVDGERVVKRILWITDEECFLVGDNSDDSYDSYNYGSLPIENIIGTAISF